jgi:hypothetical protein
LGPKSRSVAILHVIKIDTHPVPWLLLVVVVLLRFEAGQQHEPEAVITAY